MSAATDFDFLIGEWNVHLRKLIGPLSGSTTTVASRRPPAAVLPRGLLAPPGRLDLGDQRLESGEVLLDLRTDLLAERRDIQPVCLSDHGHAALFQLLDDLLRRLGHRHAAGEGDAAAAGRGAEADCGRVAHDGPHTLAVGFQPGEAIKVVLVIFIAGYLAESDRVRGEIGHSPMAYIAGTVDAYAGWKLEPACSNV